MRSAASRIHARERIERIVHHLRDLPAQVLDLAILVRRPLHGREPRGDVADFLALVADALEVGDGLDDGDDDAQIAGRGRAHRQDAAALLVDRHLHAVDLVVVGGDRFAEAAVALDQRGDGLVQLLLDEAAHLQHLVAHLLQVLVEAPGNVVGEIGRFHDVYLEAYIDGDSARTTSVYIRLRPASIAQQRNCDAHALAALRSAELRRSAVPGSGR